MAGGTDRAHGPSSGGGFALHGHILKRRKLTQIANGFAGSLADKNPGAIPEPTIGLPSETQTSHSKPPPCIFFDSLLNILSIKRDMLELNKPFSDNPLFEGTSKNFKFMLKRLPGVYCFRLIFKALVEMHQMTLGAAVLCLLKDVELTSVPYKFKNCELQLDPEVKVCLDFFDKNPENSENFWLKFYQRLGHLMISLGNYSEDNTWIYNMVLGLSAEEKYKPLCDFFLAKKRQVKKADLNDLINAKAKDMQQQLFASFREQTETVPPENQGQLTPEDVIETLNEAINDAWHDALLMLIQVRAKESKDKSNCDATKWLEKRRKKFELPENFVHGDVSESTIFTKTQMCPIKFVQNSKDRCFKEIIPSLNKLFLEACAPKAV